jgi:hypothetical protein
MAEKKGNTVKLKYDFNEARCLEIYIESLNRYGRVTCNDFRSFGGKRRILNVDNPQNVFYEDYNGPVYWFGTNKVIPENEIEPKTMFLHGRDPRNFGNLRLHERHLLDKI